MAVVSSAKPRKVGSRPGLWLALGLIVVGTILLGQIVHRQTSSASQRIVTLEKEVKCLSCIDLSVFNSQGASSFTIKTYIRNEVRLGRTNNEILDGLVSAYGSAVLMSPPGSGIDSLLWLAPLGMVVLGGVELARRRWLARVPLEDPLAVAGFQPYHSVMILESSSGQDEPDPFELWGRNELDGERESHGLDARSVSPDRKDTERSSEGLPERAWMRFFGKRQNWFLVAAIAFLLLGGGVGALAVFNGSGGGAPATLSSSQRITVEDEVVQGELLASQGSDVAALKLLASALKIDPQQPQALTYDGWLLFQAGQRDHSTALDNQGRLLLQEAASVDSTYATVHLFLGLADVALHRAPKAAVAEFNEMLKDGVNPSLLRSVRPTIVNAYRAAGLTVPKSL